jgi:hypothetical protein
MGANLNFLIWELLKFQTLCIGILTGNLPGAVQVLLLEKLRKSSEITPPGSTGYRGLEKTVTKRTTLLLTHFLRHINRITATHGPASPTPWSRVPLEKLMVAQLISNFSSIYDTQKSISVFTSARKSICLYYECNVINMATIRNVP